MLGDLLDFGPVFLYKRNYRFAIVFGNVLCFVLDLFGLAGWKEEKCVLNVLFHWLWLLFDIRLHFYYFIYFFFVRIFVVFFLWNSFVLADWPVTLHGVHCIFPVPSCHESIHEGKGLILLIMISIDLKEWLNHDGFWFGRQLIENTPEDIGSAVIGPYLLLAWDVFGGWNKAVRFYGTHIKSTERFIF